MRSGPNTRRLRGRGNGSRRHSPSRSHSYESSGPEVKVRGNAQQVVEKYLQLARDAATTGDPIMAENFYQHAEHYYRLQSAANGGGDQRSGGNPAEVARNDGAARERGNGAAGEPAVAKPGPVEEPEAALKPDEAAGTDVPGHEAG